jgi:hypothetical protein
LFFSQKLFVSSSTTSKATHNLSPIVQPFLFHPQSNSDLEIPIVIVLGSKLDLDESSEQQQSMKINVGKQQSMNLVNNNNR